MSDGALWGQIAQIGKEVTPGTAVPATRRQYWRDPSFELTQAPRIHEFATGTRETVRKVTKGPREVGGQAVMPMSADEILEWLLMGIRDGVVPTNPSVGVDLWTFKPGTSLASATVEYHDGAQEWQIAGTRINTLQIAGSVTGENLVTANFFAADRVVNPLTAALAERVPSVLEGWETTLYIENLGGAPGTTEVPGVMANWEVNINNNLGRKYLARNSKATTKIPFGKFMVDARFTFEASEPEVITEFNNWEDDVERLVRLEFGNNEVISTTYKKFVQVDIPGAWTAVNLGGTDAETRVYEFSMQALYDPTLASTLQIRVQNARATAF